MASTAIKSEEEKKEYFDSPEELDEKVSMLAEMIVMSNHMVAFTGAGISTASGIPDYRSGFNTVLKTGPGCWETAANKKKFTDLAKKKGKDLPEYMKTNFSTTISQALPNKTHMALVELQNRDHLKHVVSQNVDGLHRKSGIEPDRLSELHGNTNLELCTKCGAEQMRDFRVRCAQKAVEHKTGRKCEKPGCGGDLKDSIINFGDNLEEHILEKADFTSSMSDLYVAMGSSMRIQPACSLPLNSVRNGGNFVLINLQKTPMDQYATLVIHGKCEDVMELLMQKLGYTIPEAKIQRRLRVSYDQQKKHVTVGGIDSNGTSYTLFKRIGVTGLGAKSTDISVYSDTKFQPYRVPIDQKRNIKQFEVNMNFLGKYGEPDLKVTVPMELLTGLGTLDYLMTFDPKKKKWCNVQITEQGQVLGRAEYA